MIRPTASLPAFLAVLSLAGAGCARDLSRLAAQPIAPGRDWASPLHRDHPLAGKIWDVKAGAFVDEATVEAAVRRADLVLLGETHDNPDHHVLQARLLRAAASGGRAPAVAFEMLSLDQQEAVERAAAPGRGGKPADPAAFARAVGWEKSGWPDFKLYRPVFATAFDAHLPVVAANLPHKAVRDVIKNGEGALPPAARARIDRHPPLSPAEAKGLEAEMQASHCGALPERLLAPMVLGQRARDAQMAEALEAAGKGRGAVLVAGAGHARTDRGVPSYLGEEARARTVSVGFREVSPGDERPADYAGGEGLGEGAALPYDYVVFTPAAERDDPCEGLADKIHAREAREKKQP